MEVSPAQSFFYGSVGHAVEVLTLGQLLERVKVYRELNPATQSTVVAIQKIWQQGGISSFCQGLKWNLLLSSMKGGVGWSLNRFSYHAVHTLAPPAYEQQSPTLFSCTVGALTGSLEAALFVCPLNRLKTVAMSSDRAVRFQDLGPCYLYKGLDLTALRLSVNWITSLGIYSQVNRRLSSIENRSTKRIILGAVTGSVSALITAPMELVITRVQRASRSLSSWNEAQKVYQSYGLRGFYNGFSPKVVRATWTSIVVVYVLDHFHALPPNMQIS